MPVRTIRPNYRSVTGKVNLGPPHGMVPFESTLERDFLVLVALDPGLAAIESQPLKIPYRRPNGRRTNYYPDYRVVLGPAVAPDLRRAPFLRGESTVIAEIKYWADLKKNWEELRPGFEACREYCRAETAAGRPCVFRIYTERRIRTPFLRNVHDLRSHRRTVERDEVLRRILLYLNRRPHSTPTELLATLAETPTDRNLLLAQLWRAVAIGLVQTDLTQPLRMDSAIWSILREIPV